MVFECRDFYLTVVVILGYMDGKDEFGSELRYLEMWRMELKADRSSYEGKGCDGEGEGARLHRLSRV